MKKIVYDGLIFTRDDKTGYYLNAKTKKRLHRYVWEKHNGVIPRGYEIHHIDHNKDNNDISNLIMLTRNEHRKLHGSEFSDEQRERFRNNVKIKAIPAAIKWHGSEDGIEWHKQQYEKTKDRLHAKKKFKCKQCGKTFESIKEGFCTNACKSAYRREIGYDNETRICAKCGKPFIVNKYEDSKYCSRDCATKRKVRNIDTGEVFNSVKEAADKYNAMSTNITACCRGRQKTVCGYHWEYID